MVMEMVMVMAMVMVIVMDSMEICSDGIMFLDSGIAKHEQLMLDLYIKENSEYTLNISGKLRRKVLNQPHRSELWQKVSLT